MPLLSEKFMARLVELYRPRRGDLPADAVELPRLEGFLHQHLGLYLLPQEAGAETYGQTVR
ncbi:hypothetical protein SY2F82_77030 [Streptomyces sp. Y2F8-2]|nr:hypothetical protein SY2F82_77030 [Streptomyces sp. Y2F8-2]